MTIGAGGQTIESALESLSNMTGGVDPVARVEYETRIARLQSLMQAKDVAAVYLHAGTNLFYFTGLRWKASERMVAAVVPAFGDICYIAPQFELDTLRDYWLIESEVQAWEEHESPYVLLGRVLGSMGSVNKTVLLDEATPYVTVEGIQTQSPKINFACAQSMTQSLRARKSDRELALIQRAHEITLAVHRAAASILTEGIGSNEVKSFIDQAHKRCGIPAGFSFCSVLFDVGTSFPHGVKNAQTLKQNQAVLIDTGCILHGYHSDITRSFWFGEPTEAYQQAWDIEKQAQLAAFAAAKNGEPCEACDQAARVVLESAGYGPEYRLPGLPHRAGHGCGLDIHEGPYLVRGEKTPLDSGMVFSSEPMLVIPDQFGIRLEDHFYMTDDGPKWITQPSHSVNDPFGLDAS